MQKVETTGTELTLDGSGALFSVGFRPELPGRSDTLVRVSIRRDRPDGVLICESIFRESDGFIPDSPDENAEPWWQWLLGSAPVIFGRICITQVGGRGKLSVNYLDADAF
jgi:hypothetical protein